MTKSGVGKKRPENDLLRPFAAFDWLKLFDDVAGGVSVLDWAEVEFLQAGLDFCTVAYGHQDELVGMDVGLGGFGDFGGGDGFEAGG
ncbi:hypothetical protein RBB78_09880 [Tunturiibacter empetritectus]|uniref:hypothetical protein n=1 Tax=Tunturiibacter empetritectus TaxID=3069691 RepID=UPI003D9B2014